MTAYHVLSLMLLTGVIESKLLTNRLEQIESNSIDVAPAPRVNGLRAHDWIKISEAPPTLINIPAGERLEIECEVIGSPAPEVQWLHPGKSERRERIQVENVASNLPSLHERAGIAKMRARLTIECITPRHQGFYNCVSRAGTRRAQAPSTLILIEGSGSARCKDTEQGAVKQPHISVWSPTAMETMGSDVVLPCTASGNPQPTIYWLDQDNNVINNSRYQVLDNGDLVISRITWSDMGQLTCIAENSAGRDTVNTFLYPVLNEK